MAIELDTQFHVQRALKQSRAEQEARERQEAAMAADQQQHAQPLRDMADFNAEPPRLFRAYDTSLILLRGLATGGTLYNLELSNAQPWRDSAWDWCLPFDADWRNRFTLAR